jgi:hypothetical protein
MNPGSFPLRSLPGRAVFINALPAWGPEEYAPIVIDGPVTLAISNTRATMTITSARATMTITEA